MIPDLPAAGDRPSRLSMETSWYDLFSRGARDWLRHNEKVREAVKDQLVDLLAGGDFITQPERRTVQVPIRLLEHARFRLADTQKQSGAGQTGRIVPARFEPVIEESPRMGLLDQRFGPNLVTTTLDKVFNWARKSALWPMSFGRACCAIGWHSSSAFPNPPPTPPNRPLTFALSLPI